MICSAKISSRESSRLSRFLLLLTSEPSRSLADTPPFCALARSTCCTSRVPSFSRPIPSTRLTKNKPGSPPPLASRYRSLPGLPRPLVAAFPPFFSLYLQPKTHDLQLPHARRKPALVAAYYPRCHNSSLHGTRNSVARVTSCEPRSSRAEGDNGIAR